MSADSGKLMNALRWGTSFIPPQFRPRPGYVKWQRFLKSAQYWSPEQIRQWQLERLREIVRHAITHTEGYRELYRKASIRPEDIRTLEDIRHLPRTTKETFRDNLETFSVPTKARNYVTTGGSTGIPLCFYENQASRNMENAFMHAGWSWAGWRLGQTSAVLRGLYVGSPESISWYNHFRREVYLSSFYLSPQTFPLYPKEFSKHNVRAIQAYPSALNHLCDLLAETGTRLYPEIEVVLLGSENLYPYQLEKFQKTFPKARIHAWYGHSEKAILAPWCEKGRVYHCWPFYGFTEVVAPDGREISEGDEGHLIGTSFHQRVTPFIRYETMDRAVKGPSHCLHCGRSFPLLNSISGRHQDVIVTNTGRFMSMASLIMHDDIFDPLSQFQFQQERSGEVDFAYVPRRDELTDSERRRIESGLIEKLGPDVRLTLKKVAEIPRTPSGKLRIMDQRMKIRYSDNH